MIIAQNTARKGTKAAWRWRLREIMQYLLSNIGEPWNRMDLANLNLRWHQTEKQTDLGLPLCGKTMAVPIRLVDLASRTIHGMDCIIAVPFDLRGTCGLEAMPVWPKWRLAEVSRDSEGTSQKA